MLTYQDVLDAKSKLDEAKAKLAGLSEDYDAKDRTADVPPEMHGEWVAAGRERDAAAFALKLMARGYLAQCAGEAYRALYDERERLAGKPLWYKRTETLAVGIAPSFEGVYVGFGSRSGLILGYMERDYQQTQVVSYNILTPTDPTGKPSGWDHYWFARASEWPVPTANDEGRTASDVMSEAAEFERRRAAVRRLRADYVRAVRNLAAPYVSDERGYCANELEKLAFDRYEVGCDFTL